MIPPVFDDTVPDHKLLHLTTVTSASGLNIEFVYAIDARVAHHTAHPKPFIWTASTDELLVEGKRTQRTLVMVHSV